MLKFVILFQLCLAGGIDNPADVQCVRIISEPIYTNRLDCELQAKEVGKWVQDEIDQIGGASVLYARCVNTYTMDYLEQFK